MLVIDTLNHCRDITTKSIRRGIKGLDLQEAKMTYKEGNCNWTVLI